MKKTLSCLLPLVLFFSTALGQLREFSKNVRIRVIASTEVQVWLEDGRAWPAQFDYSGSSAFELLEVPDSWNSDPRVRPTPVNISGAGGELLFEGLFLKISGLPLATGKSYFLAVRDVQSGEDIGRGFFSTKPEAMILPTGADADRRRRVRIVSDVDFKGEVSANTLQEIYRNKLKKEDGKETAERRINHPVEVARPKGYPNQNPDAYGVADVSLRENDRLWSRKPTLRVEGLRDVFDQPVTAQGEIELGGIPVGKDDASFYFKIGSDAGKRAFPSYSIEAKAKPEAGWLGDFVFYPSVDIDIAKNVADSANTMNFSGLLNYKKPTGSSVLAFEFGGTFETDRDFDSTNLLSSFVFAPRIAKLYRPRDLATWQRFSRLFRQGKVTKLEEVAPVEFGYGLEILLGVEGGSSLQDRSVQNRLRTATLDIPRYGIFRLRPSIRLFLEYKQFTLDISSALRILVSDELSARELSDGSLQLRSVDGFRPYTTTSLSYQLDRHGRIALVVQYNNGSAPPLYGNVNKVTSGVEFKY